MQAKVLFDSKSLRTFGKETRHLAAGTLTLAFTVSGSQSLYTQEKYGQRNPRVVSSETQRGKEAGMMFLM